MDKIVTGTGILSNYLALTCNSGVAKRSSFKVAGKKVLGGKPIAESKQCKETPPHPKAISKEVVETQDQGCK